jgi:putative PEP-CTERM system TPR-repeat lipoprotein
MALTLAWTGCDGQTKEQLLHDGQQFSQKENYRGAIVFYKKALKKDQNFFEARYLLADAYLNLGEFKKAEKEFQKVACQSPEYRQLPLKLAEIYIYTNRLDKAFEQLDAYLKKHPRESKAYDLLGTAYSLKKEYPAAEKAYRKALQLAPDDLLPKLHYARLLLVLKKEAAARQLLEEIVSGKDKDNRKSLIAYYMLAGLEQKQGQADRAISIYRQIRKKFPFSFRAAYLEGLLLLDKGKKEFDAVGKLAAGLIKSYPTRPEGYLLKGLLLYAQKDFSGAEAELLNAVKYNAHDPLALYYLGQAYLKQGKLDLALNQFQQILDLNPKATQARIMVGTILMRQKHFDDAVNELQKAIEADEQSAAAHNALGSAYLAKGLYDKAMLEFDRALEINPNLVDAHLKKGLYSLMKGDSGKTEEELVKALEAAPEVINTRLLLGAFYARQQNYEKAVRTMQEGLTGKPSDALLYNYIASVWIAQHKNDKALEVLRKAKEIKPDYFTPYFRIAAYHVVNGNYDKALSEYQALLKIDAKNLKALQATAFLYELKGDHAKAREYFVKASETGNPAGYIELAKFYQRSGNSAEALKTAESALKRDPANPVYLELKGRLLLEEGKLEEAAEPLRSLEQLRPGRGIPLLLKAYLKEKKFDQARALAEKVISDHPERDYGYLLLAETQLAAGDDAAAEKVLLQGLEKKAQPGLVLRLRLGALYESRGDYDAAQRCYVQAAKEFPRSTRPAFMLAAMYDKLGDKRKARKIYEEILARNGRDAATLNNLAYLYAENYSNEDKALELAMKAYRIAPTSSAIIDTLGYILWQNGRYDDARKMLEKAAALMKDNPTVKYHLAQVYVSQKDFNKALPLLREVMAGNSSFPKREEAAKLLAEVEKQGGRK